MPIAFTSILTQGTDLGSLVTTTTTSGSITPAADTLYLATVITKDGLAGDSTATLSGAGVTWVNIGAVRQAGTSRTFTLFRAFGAGSTGQLTFTRDGSAQFQKFGIIVASVTGADPSGTNGSGAIAQVVSLVNSSTNAPTIPITMVSGSNAVYAAFSSGAGAFTGTATNGFTELVEAALATHFSHRSQYITTSVTSIDATWSGTIETMGLGVEVKVAAAASSAPSRITLSFRPPA
jgi:hypothetical protein